jgi:very-short-patch-repair endonuclease
VLTRTPYDRLNQIMTLVEQGSLPVVPADYDHVMEQIADEVGAVVMAPMFDLLNEAKKNPNRMAALSKSDKVSSAQDVRAQADPKFKVKVGKDYRRYKKEMDAAAKRVHADIHRMFSMLDWGRTRGDFEGFRQRTVSRLKQAHKVAFELGRQAAGLSKNDAKVSGDSQAEKLFDTMLGKEVSSFIDFLSRIEPEKGQREFTKGAEAYAKAVYSSFEAGRTQAAPGLSVFHWHLEPQASKTGPCPDCVLIAKYSPYTRETLPSVPKGGLTRCFVGKNQWYRVITPDGYKPIHQIRKGDLVLTHDGTYQPVTGLYHADTSDNVCRDPFVVKLTMSRGVDRNKGVNDIYAARRTYYATGDHQFLTASGWRRADALTAGDDLLALGHRCKICGALVDYWDDRRQSRGPYCSRRCASRDPVLTQQRVVAGAPARKRQADSMRGVPAQTRLGFDDAAYADYLYRSTAAAHTRTRELAILGRHNFQCANSTPEERKHRASYGNSCRKDTHSATRAMLLSQQRKFTSKPERVFMLLLSAMGIEYQHQVPVGNYVVDFYLPALDLYCEVDGDYWHANPRLFPRPNAQQLRHTERDRIKDELLCTRGMKLKRFWASELDQAEGYFTRLTMNHDGRFEQYPVRVESVELVRPDSIRSAGKRADRMYCLAVAGNESCVLDSGLISHNCRSHCYCVLEVEVTDEKTIAKLRKKHITRQELLKRIQAQQGKLKPKSKKSKKGK